MPSKEALKTLLARWNAFLKGTEPKPEWRAWWALFGYLRDVRVFSAQDRIDPSIKRYVEALLNSDPNRPIVIEVDLWYRNDKQLQDQAVATLHALLDEVGGEMLDLVTIPEIRYQAALVRVPAQIAKSLSEQHGKLANANGVMTIRPQSFFQTTGDTVSAPGLPDLVRTQAASNRCIAAIIDGYPIAAHAALDGKIIVHEVDLTGAQVPVSSRYHGTAMASLVAHDDLHEPKASPEQKVVIVPVLTGNGRDSVESTPPGKLPIGMIYRAIRSLVVGLDDRPAAFPNVVLINHSICDEYAPFVKRPSPWATLLDYFSHKHRLLFIVSAGNIRSSFPMPLYDGMAEDIRTLDPLAREAQIILAIERAKGTRGLLSPAESINSITVGALHADRAGPCPAGVADPYPTLAMPNLGSAVGLGVNRSVKPDLLHHGGRLAAVFSQTAHNGYAVRGESSQHLGQLVAAPDQAGGSTRQVVRLAGTSNAAALVTRTGIRIAEAIEPVFRAGGHDWLVRPTRAAILKTLLAHGCSWGSVGERLDTSYPPAEPNRRHARRETIARFLGYGGVNAERVLSGNENLVTLLADDVIEPETLHEYRVPVPSEMIGNRELRRITITLAWTTPVLVTTAEYRGVTLALVDEKGERKFWKGVQRHCDQPNSTTTERGTIIHHIFEGKKLVRLAADPKGIFIGVQCRATHPTCETAKVPYALAVSLELAQSAKGMVYTEVSNAVTVRSRLRTRT
ncbi:hypothetical protein LMG18101_00960 [Ralstonia flaminis]|uniref:Peptidase S8/S53 domain-containing protein n=2 Tax=Ralstonia flaminis TaxID=3058597 RepID=A0ABN9JGE8_9RALS|nr:hypothetical protein LMG18101_00960 [Ralstonia sp. LMG 18101]